MADEGTEEERTTGPKLWIVMARAYRAIAEVLEDAIAGDGMCLSDFMVLEVLLHKGSQPMSAIGEKVQLANASMTAAIDRLEGLGLAERGTSPCDKRVRMVKLTEPGRTLITEVYARHERQIESLMEDLSCAERTRLRRGLKKIGLRAKEMAASQVRERKDRAPSL